MKKSIFIVSNILILFFPFFFLTIFRLLFPSILRVFLCFYSTLHSFLLNFIIFFFIALAFEWCTHKFARKTTKKQIKLNKKTRWNNEVQTSNNKLHNIISEIGLKFIFSTTIDIHTSTLACRHGVHSESVGRFTIRKLNFSGMQRIKNV